jgi:hypothetical protein
MQRKSIISHNKINKMRKILICLVSIFPLAVFGQTGDWNPYVSAGIISPAPLIPVENNGTGTASFNVGNSGSSVLDLMGNPARAMELTVTLSYGEPDVADPTNQAQVIASMSGTFLSYFTWTYNHATKTFSGVQNQNIPGGISAVGNINIPYRVTTNSDMALPQNGFNCNLTPPPYTNGVNSTGDDAVSSYTWTSSPILPVTGLELGGVRNGADVNLLWQTVSELNTKQFDLERSYDGAQFTHVTMLKAAGNSQGRATYKFTDKNVTAPVAYYRVKLTDMNGKITISNIAIVRVANGGIVRVFPNPVIANYYVSFPQAGKYRLQLMDGAGRIVMAKDMEITVDNLNVLIDRGVLAAGSYHLSVQHRSTGNWENIKLIFTQH